MVWGEILGFTCKSLDKSSDFMDFINPWIYQIYLRTIISPSRTLLFAKSERLFNCLIV